MKIFIYDMGISHLIQLLGGLIITIAAVFITYEPARKNRKSFKTMLKSNGAKVIGLNLVNELLNSFGGVLSTFAGTIASISLVSFATQSVQPFAVIIMGILITKLSPKIEKENMTKKKSLSIALR